MAYASHFIKLSKKNAHKFLSHEPAIFIRFFARYGGPAADGLLEFSTRSFPAASSGFNPVHRAIHPDNIKVSLPKAANENVIKSCLSTACLHLGKTSPCLQLSARRCFSTGSGLPPHQEIGMPSLSPTMTAGNIARWLKKEGDRVSPGEVLCEIETDKATVEMECMEEGYIAKIIRGNGEKDIQVGEVIAITVEEEEDIEKFKDYKASASSAGGEVKDLRDSVPPKKEVPSSSTEGTGSEGGTVKANVEDHSDLPLHQKIGMPSLSPTMMAGNIARWLKKEGDKVSPGEVLCEVETDKATVEMECMEDGYLAKIIRGDGEKNIQVGEVIAITVEEEEDIEKFKDYKASASTAAGKAEELLDSVPPKKEVPFSSTKATGSEGHNVKADTGENKVNAASSSKVTTASVRDSVSQTTDFSELPLSQIRKVTASRLLLSKRTIPHYYLTVDACVNKLADLRSKLNMLQEESRGKRISVNDFVIKAAALALRKVPQCNSTWENDFIRQYHNVNINVAMQTDNGLYVPVIRDADKKGLLQISEEVKHLAQKAKDNSLKPEDYEGGTFTVSNLGGPFGISRFCAIVNPPQAAILAVGSAERRVIQGDGLDQFEFASFMPLTLSCDHRVIDGAIGALYLKAFKEYIENPQTMLL